MGLTPLPVRRVFRSLVRDSISVDIVPVVRASEMLARVRGPALRG
jgi:hypothetical protein